MQTWQKGDALSPGPTDCIFEPRTNEKNTADVGLLAAYGSGAQDPISLKDAVHLSLNRNKAVEAADASRKAAESRIAEARSGNLPKVNYSESWTRSDNPVFVFSSLLTQHQFGEQNFQIGPLNRPDFRTTSNRSSVSSGPLRESRQCLNSVTWRCCYPASFSLRIWPPRSRSSASRRSIPPARSRRRLSFPPPARSARLPLPARTALSTTGTASLPPTTTSSPPTSPRRRTRRSPSAPTISSPSSTALSPAIPIPIPPATPAPRILIPIRPPTRPSWMPGPESAAATSPTFAPRRPAVPPASLTTSLSVTTSCRAASSSS